jgi:hypothetical protein
MSPGLKFIVIDLSMDPPAAYSGKIVRTHVELDGGNYPDLRSALLDNDLTDDLPLTIQWSDGTNWSSDDVRLYMASALFDETIAPAVCFLQFAINGDPKHLDIVFCDCPVQRRGPIRKPECARDKQLKKTGSQ